MTKYTGRFIRIRNLEKYQHYRTRNAPWVKLHQAVLEDYDFARLPDQAKWHCLGLLLLSARLQNEIPADPNWLKSKLNATSAIDLQLLVNVGFIEYYGPCLQDASETLASCKQVAMREGEGEGDREGETTFVGLGAKDAPNRPSDRPLSETDWRIEQVWSAHLAQWRGYYEDVNGKAPIREPSLTEEIRQAIKVALKEYDSHLMAAEHRDRWLAESKARAAGVGIFLDSFLTGQSKDNDIRNGGKRFLEHWRPWKVQRGKGSPVDRFAELYFEAKSLTEPSRPQPVQEPDDVAF